MANPMRTNSPISDPAPFQTPEIKKPVKKRKRKTEFEKLVENKKFPQIALWIESRKEFYRHYLPDGKEVKNLSREERADWWAISSAIIDEYELFAEKLRDEVKMSKM